MRLYIYFRVRREDEAAAVQALRALQAAWHKEHPGLRCRLLRRVDDAADEVTLMETYEDVDAAWQQRIEREATTALSGWLLGQRHVEAFTPCA